jgi:hypothetical protein
MKSLEKEFENDMYGIAHKCVEQNLDYYPTRLLQMIDEKGGLYVARELINDKPKTYGYKRLTELGQLSITVESLVIAPKYRNLFSAIEIERCEKRLGKLLKKK